MDAVEKTQHDEDVAVAAVAAVSTDEPTDILDELAKLREPATPAASDLRTLLAAAELEELGVWEHWPELEGAEFLIAHLGASNDKRQRLEERFREKHQVTDPVLPPVIREALFRESFYGTVIKGWRGVVLDGKPFEFSEANCRTLLRVRTFRSWIFRKASDVERFRSQRAEAVRGN